MDVVFNLAERFRGASALDYTVAAVLEMLGFPYTGAVVGGAACWPATRRSRRRCSPTRGSASRTSWSARTEHRCSGRATCASRSSSNRWTRTPRSGIAQASVVRDDDALKERVTFIHDRFKTDAIVEEFIAGRELYIGVMGNDPPIALPPIEMVFSSDSTVESRIATFKAKWSVRYRESKGIQNAMAQNLSDEVRQRLAEVARARLPGGGAARLRPHRRAAGARRRDLHRRGQPQPLPGRRRGSGVGGRRGAATRTRISSKRSPRWPWRAGPPATERGPGRSAARPPRRDQRVRIIW